MREGKEEGRGKGMREGKEEGRGKGDEGRG